MAFPAKTAKKVFNNNNNIFVKTNTKKTQKTDRETNIRLIKAVENKMLTIAGITKNRAVGTSIHRK